MSGAAALERVLPRPLARYLAPAIGRLLPAPSACRPRPSPPCCNRSRGYIAVRRLVRRRFRECSHGVGRWNFACYHRHRPEAGATHPARAAFGPPGRRRSAGSATSSAWPVSLARRSGPVWRPGSSDRWRLGSAAWPACLPAGRRSGSLVRPARRPAGLAVRWFARQPASPAARPHGSPPPASRSAGPAPQRSRREEVPC